MSLTDYFLCALIAVSIIVMTVVSVFLIKFLKTVTGTAESLRKLADMTNTEIKPALVTLNEVLSTVKNVSRATNNHIEIVKNVLTTLLGASCIAFTNVKNKGGFFSGLISGFNMFRKKRR